MSKTGVSEGLQDVFKIGENDYGYWFGVARMNDRWVGFAFGDNCIFFLPGVHECHELGLLDRDMAIKLTGANAQALENGYGGISRWFVDESLRGRPEDFRCPLCEEMGCQGECDAGREDSF